MAARSIGWTASPNFETGIAAFDGNGRTPDCLARIKSWLSLGDRVSASAKVALTANDTDYRLEAGAAGLSFIRPGHAHAPRVADPQHGDSCKWKQPAVFSGRGRVGVRLRALSAMAASGSPTDLLLLSPGSGAVRNSACGAPALNYSVVSDVPAGGPASALRLEMTAASTQTTQCVRSQFPAPLNLSSSRVLEFTVYGDGSGAVLDIQLQDASAGVREFFLTLNFTGWKTVRPMFPATRGLYTHAGGQIPWASHPGGNDNRAMRAFSWSTLLAVNFEMTNTKQTVVFVGKIEALAEEAATTDGATLSVGRSKLTVPSLRGGTQADADYLECADVTNASSCQGFDSNNWQLNNTAVVSVTEQDGGGGVGDGGSIPVEYKPAGANARVEVSLFEWATDADRLGPF